MPTYAYACTQCDHHFETVQSFTDDSLTQCPQCEGRLRKLFNAVGVVFKGSGFYRTDSRSNRSNGGAKGSGSATNGGASGGSSANGTSTSNGGGSTSTTGGSNGPTSASGSTTSSASSSAGSGSSSSGASAAAS